MKLFLRRTLVQLEILLNFYLSEDRLYLKVGQATNIGEELSLNIDANYKITIFGNS